MFVDLYRHLQAFDRTLTGSYEVSLCDLEVDSSRILDARLYYVNLAGPGHENRNIPMLSAVSTRFRELRSVIQTV
jgi:hypothetical protein